MGSWMLKAIGIAIGVLMLGAGPAYAETTIGSVTPPIGSTASTCAGAFFAPYESPSLSEYAIPSAGRITSWQINTIDATPEAPITLLILRPLELPDYEVVGADSEQLPSPLPTGEVASFTLASPIDVQSGDLIALYAPNGSSARCYFGGGTTPEANRIILGSVSSSFAPGETLVGVIPSPEKFGFVLNVAATLAQPADLSVSTSVAPTSTTVGEPVELISTIANNGPGDTSSATVRDTVPAGLSISSAISDGGACPVFGQTVTCTIANMTAGSSGFVLVTATASSPGSYTNSVSVSGPEEDPDPGNNDATATLSVSAPATVPPKIVEAEKHCLVPSLPGASSKLAKSLLPLLGCKVGKVTQQHSKMAKGTLISTNPKPGTYAAGRQVSLVVSLGPKPKPKKRSKRRSRKHKH